jgi:hypothetical protein
LTGVSTLKSGSKAYRELRCLCTSHNIHNKLGPGSKPVYYSRRIDFILDSGKHVGRMQPTTPLVDSLVLSGDMIPCGGDSFDRGRRRRWHDSACPDLSSSELSPLEVDADRSNKNYATFSRPDKHHYETELLPYWRFLVSLPWDNHAETIAWQKKKHRSSPLNDFAGGAIYGQHPYSVQRYYSTFGCCSWKVLYSTLLMVGLSAIYYRNYREVENGQHGRFETKPESQWDHNIYMPPNSAKSAPYTHFLIAQEALASLTEISSKPNRAYARQHGMDYLRYAWGGPSSLYTQCFDKVVLINIITDKQSDEDEAFQRGIFPPLFSLPAQIEYDAVVLLPPDSIVMNLDYSIFDVLPSDKLVAIAGWGKDDQSHITSKTDIIYYNLRHKYANAVAKLWRDLVDPFEVSCGDGNDISLLVDAIASVLEDGEGMSSVIVSLQESSEGYLRQRIDGDDRPQDDIFLGITPSTPGPRAQMLLNNWPNVLVELETRANAVCYRHWPRCEVL